MKEKLTIEHLAPYLAYSVKLIDYLGNKYNISYLSTKRIAFIDIKGYGDVQKLRWEYASGKIKPILHPLSGLTKEIEINGERFVPIEIIKQEWFSKHHVGLVDAYLCFDYIKTLFQDGLIQELPAWVHKLLHKWHFAVNIPEHLYIDINTL